MNEDEERAPFEASYLPRIIKMLWQAGGFRLVGLIAATVGMALLPGVQLHLTATAVQTVADAISSGNVAGATDDVIRVGLLLLGVAVLAHLFSVIYQYLESVLRLQLTTSISEQVMHKGTRMELQDYEDANSYDKLQRAFQESNGSRMHQLFSDSIEFVRELVTILSVSAVLFSWNPWLAALILLAPIPAALAQMLYGKKMYEIEYKRAPDRRRLLYYQYLTTTDHSFKEIRLFNLGPYFIDRYRKLVRHFLRIDRGVTRRQSSAFGLLGLLTVLISSGALIYAMYTTMNTGQIGELAGYLQAVGIVQGSATTLLMNITMLLQNVLYIGNLFQLFDMPEQQVASGTKKFPKKLSSGIEFRNVSFTYPGCSDLVLDNASFQMPAGECVALVGQNGAGKTTLVKLLTRLYEPTAGQILIDGVPVEEYDLDSLRQNMGVIFQDYIKYEMRVRDNIGFGRIEALDDDERIQAAATASGAAPIIDRIDGKYEATLGRHFERGHQLSGGQWQKVALARAFMRSAPVVVLDEPTAAIDAEAEVEIFGRLRDIAEKSTSLLIAHRFSTVRMADKIVVVHDGKVIEQGTHAELLRDGGQYSYLFNLQAAGYQTETETAVG